MLIAQQDTASACFYEFVPRFKTTQCDRVLAYVLQNGPATLSEIGDALGMPAGTVSARAAELRAKNKLMWGPDERKSRASNVTCKTLVRYQATQIGMFEAA